MAMTPKAKAAFLRRINKGRRKAGLKPIRAKRAKGHAKAKRAGTTTKRASSKPRRSARSAAQKAATRKMIAARRAQLSGAEPRKPKRKTAAKKGHTMAKKKGKGKKHHAPKKHRRSRRRTVTVTGFRRVTMSNPLKGGFITTGITGLAAGAATGFITTKFLGERSAGLRAGASAALAIAGAMLLKRKPVLADAWAASALGSIGYAFGVNASGGVCVTNKADAIAATAKLPDAKTGTTSTGQQGMGVLVPLPSRGMGVLTAAPGAGQLVGGRRAGMGAPMRSVRDPRALIGMG